MDLKSGENAGWRVSAGEAVLFSLGVALTILIVAWSYGLRHFSIKVPINFSGDAVLTLSAIQNAIHGGWYFETDNLGYPFGQALQDFPAVADGLFLLMLRFLVFFTSNPAVVFNCLFFVAFPLNYAGCFLGLRMLRVRVSFSTVLALIFAVVPYNFLHGPPHVGLVWNFSIPIWLAYILRQSSSEPMVSLRDSDGLLRRQNLRPILIAVGIGLMAGSTGFYYFIFFLLLAIPMGVRELVQKGRAFSPWILVSAAASLVVVAIQIAPVLLFQTRFGSNTLATTRLIGEVVLYGLKPASLFVSPHYSRLGDITAWLKGFEPSAENATSLGLTLGLVLCVSVAGFLFSTWLKRLEVRVVVFYLILSMPYGGGYIFGLFGFTQVRVWSRVSIVLASLAVFIFARWLEDSWSSSRIRKVFVVSVVVVGVVVQLLDSVPRNQNQVVSGVASDWQEVRTFTQDIQDRFGSGLSIFQLPIVPFPEHPPVGSMFDYDHLKPYVANPQLRLSYGGVKGRAVPWQERLGTDPLTQIRGVQLAGFKAVWIDRWGWSGEENPYEELLSRLTENRRLVSASGRYALYAFDGPTKPRNEEEKVRQRAILSPVLPAFEEGFSPVESDGKQTWRWAGKEGKIRFVNLERRAVDVEIQMSIELRDIGNLLLPPGCNSDTLPEGKLVFVSCKVKVPAKGTVLKVRTTVGQIEDDDPRDLRFRVLEIATYQVDR